MKVLVAYFFLLTGFSVAFSETLPPCGARMTPAEAYQKAAAVFVGKVIDVKQLEIRLKPGTTIPYLEVKLKVEKSWKLIDQQEIIVRTQEIYENTCGNFKLGETYLVYADQLNDTFHVSPLSRTNRLVDATEDIEHLGRERIVLKSGEFRTYRVMTYGILICVLLALVIGAYVYRLIKKPLQA